MERVGNDSFQGEQEYALDNLCNSVGDVALGAGNSLYAGWAGSRPAGHRIGCAGHPATAGTQGCLTEVEEKPS
jgi:hypothetical protein